MSRADCINADDAHENTGLAISMMMEAPGAVQFVVPRREVTDASLVESWTNSQAYSDIFGLVQAFNEAAKGKACQKDSEGNSEVGKKG